MQVFVFIIVLLLAQTAFAQADMPDFKGVKLGATMAEVQQSNPNLHCGESTGDNKVFGDSYCRSYPPKKETIAGAPSSGLDYSFYNDKLSRVLVFFHPRDFDQVRLAMVEKYGQPTSNLRPVIKTRSGVEYENAILEWESAASLIRVEKFAGRIDSSTFSMRTQESVNEGIRRQNEQGRKGAKDL